MIKFEKVSFSYGGADVIKEISFSIEKGEFAAIIGANGAGKTTVSKLCNGLLKPSSGRVLTGGLDTVKTKTSLLARKVGFLFQNPDRQICQNTVGEEIAFGLRCIMDDTDEIERRLASTLERFGFEADRDPFTMSRGERQRVALASLIACRPEMLILDEPTTGLDYRECMHIMEIVSELNADGTTVVMVSHDMEVVLDFAKKVLVVNGGRLMACGPARKVLADRELLSAASVLPPQICDLALRLGCGFEGVFTVDEMVSAIEGKVI